MLEKVGEQRFRLSHRVLVLAAIALLVLGFAQSALAEQGKSQQLTTMPSTSVAYLPDVTSEMSDPAFWIAKQKNPNNILADRDLIDQLNLAGVDADGTMLQPLKAAKERYYTAEEQQRTKEAAAAELQSVFVGQVFDEHGVRLTKEGAEEILANFPTDGAAPDIASGFAIVTNHTTMRCYPTNRALMYTLGDYDDDNLYLAALRVNEPLLVRGRSVDGKFLLCISSCMQASWVPTEDVAICKDRDEWLSAWDIPAGQELVVCGYKVRTEQSNVTPNTANRMLYMGTVLERVDGADPTELVGTRSAYNNHVCYLPVRNDDGTYSKEMVLIAESERVSEGYLPLTTTNVATVALRSLGQMYGWGGMLEANDCSGYVRDVYKCFGLELARNTTWQMNMPVRTYDLAELDDAHKAAAIAQMPLGTVLFWGGHEMIYLGQDQGKLYVISATGAIGNLFGETGTTQVKGVVINTLDMVRGNRNTWLSTLTKANVPYVPASAEGPGLYDMAFYENAIVWPGDSYPYTGSVIEPPVEVVGLAAGADYSVSYSDNVEPGVATITVLGEGAYRGTVAHSFVVESEDSGGSGGGESGGGSGGEFGGESGGESGSGESGGGESGGGSGSGSGGSGSGESGSSGSGGSASDNGASSDSSASKEGASQQTPKTASPTTTSKTTPAKEKSSVTSSVSKTGDDAPLAVIALVVLAAGGAVLFARRRA